MKNYLLFKSIVVVAAGATVLSLPFTDSPPRANSSQPEATCSITDVIFPEAAAQQATTPEEYVSATRKVIILDHPEGT